MTLLQIVHMVPFFPVGTDYDQQFAPTLFLTLSQPLGQIGQLFTRFKVDVHFLFQSFRPMFLSFDVSGTLQYNLAYVQSPGCIDS